MPTWAISGARRSAISWLTLVYPCLMLNYMGQGALLLGTPAAVENPFYLMAPEWARLPLVLIATAATIIASQAVISGAFSVTHQAIQLGFLPRLRTLHTSAEGGRADLHPGGQLGPAGDGAAAGARLPRIDQPRLGLWHRGDRHDDHHHADAGVPALQGVELEPVARGAARSGCSWLVDGTYFASNITKIPDGGWFPLVVAAVLFTVLTTWATGRALMRERLEEAAMPLEVFIKSAAASVHRVRGTAVFLSASPDGIPVGAAPQSQAQPGAARARADPDRAGRGRAARRRRTARLEVHDAGDGFYRVILHYGFMEEVDIPRDLAGIDSCGEPFNMMSTSFFLGRQKLIALEGTAGHGAVARAAVRLDDEELGKRDGVLQAADQPGRRAGQPTTNIAPARDAPRWLRLNGGIPPTAVA